LETLLAIQIRFLILNPKILTPAHSIARLPPLENQFRLFASAPAAGWKAKFKVMSNVGILVKNIGA
jgi:hypothetical protein